ncbi:hypothetical protein PFNF135_01697 [Plasmodium falciparum NF135/5.C10]|uniref:Surface antigen n=1 Tax=Plasmodium falciparum NF135/5.C10 TaxID=1036726 RepID=W4IJP7_PLAFA|nr:hypothetical protein PFNF135_01697 [Plasmodium falciparum NF135/5.C10]
MKVHYINILLYVLLLNILVSSPEKYPSITTHHTPKIPTTRLLCECEQYIPNYDNDQEMKAVMEIFNTQTQQRFHEYEDRMQSKRMQCKEQCDKEIQKIILKDKMEKELMDKFATLHTDIQSDAIPSCVCEKSIADKTEKFCLNCGKTMGGVAPCWGLVCGVGYAGWTQYVAATVLQAGIKKGIEVGFTKVKEIVTRKLTVMTFQIPPITVADLTSVGEFTDGVTLHGVFKAFNIAMGNKYDEEPFGLFSTYVQSIANTKRMPASWFIPEKTAIETAVKATETTESTRLAAYTSMLNHTIIASAVAIVVIILVMVIIYLILRYRRKKKMKKKLQYIKLLK